MLGNKKVIDQLNKALAAESSHILQYVVHSSICSNWGYAELGKYIMGRAREEMKHLDMLVDRILFLEGIPMISMVDPIHVANKVPEMFDNDHDAEESVIATYNAAIATCVEAGDNDTRQLLEQILLDETRHIDIIESNISQIDQMGIGIYLSNQV